jgi:predicted Fe-Mo cluster-binding NifX family protein
MKVALTVWNERIAPVWDTAGRVLIVDEKREDVISLEGMDIIHRAQALADAGVETLVCGAISRPALHWVIATGIQVHPFTSGSVIEVLSAWREGRLDDPVHAMPGCCRRQRCRGRNHH